MSKSTSNVARKTCALLCAAALAAAAVPVPQSLAVTGSHVAPDGHYSATSHCSEGYDITVSFDVVDGRIANTGYQASPSSGSQAFYDRALSGIAVDGVVASVEGAEGIDTVSGATHTVDTIKAAVASALRNAEAGVEVKMAEPIRDQASGKYTVTLEAYATSPEAFELKGTQTELRLALGDQFSLKGADLSAEVWSYEGGDWKDAQTTLNVAQMGERGCAVTGFDYAQHSLGPDGSQGAAGAAKVVLTAKGVDPVYTNADQHNVLLNLPGCGLYENADATSRIAGPADSYKVDIPAYVTLPEGKDLAYTGEAQDGVEFDKALCTSQMTTSATEIGTYYASVSLRQGKGLRWADGTWDAKLVEWHISEKGASGEAAKHSFGSAATELAPGAYTVPVSARHATRHEDESAAASAFHSTATLNVAEDGQATLIAEIESVKLMGLEGHASGFKVYRSQKADGSLDRSAGLADATVLRNRTVTPANNGPSEVPQTVVFDIPQASWDGIYLNVYVDAMNSSPDLWLRIDYAQAVEEGSAVVYTGTSRVMQFGEYDVNVKVSVAGEVITGVEVEGSGFEGDKADVNRVVLQNAIDGMKNKWDNMWVGHGHSNAEQIYYAGGEGALDAVSGATYSSKAIRDAVMNALELSWSEDDTVVPASVASGTYTVPVSYYTDVVLHQLAGTEQAPATLTVAADGSMSIALDLKNGTAREPLYTLAVNGYYAGNDMRGSLETKGLKTTRGTVAYTDEYFAEGTPVVAHVDVPLVGGLAKEYATQVRIYVPVMNKLTGTIKGITFDHGVFDGDAFIKVHWNGLKRVAQDAGAVKPPTAAGEKTAAEKAAALAKASSINTATVSAAQVKRASDLGATTVTLGAKVKKIAAGAFKGTKVKTLVVKTTKLNKKRVKNSLKGSAVTTVKVQVKAAKSTKGLKGKKLKAAKKANKEAKATNKKYVKKYKKLFTKKVCGKKPKVK